MEDTLIVQEKVRCENVKLLHDIKKYLIDNYSETVKNQSVWLIVELIAVINEILLMATLCGNGENLSRGMSIAIGALGTISFIFLLIANIKKNNSLYSGAKNKYGSYGMLLFFSIEDPSVKKIKVSRNRKKIKIYRKYKNIVLNNDAFVIQGAGNNVYLIDLDDRYLFAD